jgi:hypothetical protein
MSTKILKRLGPWSVHHSTGASCHYHQTWRKQRSALVLGRSRVEYFDRVWHTLRGAGKT